jgi:hypothetical protein
MQAKGRAKVRERCSAETNGQAWEGGTAKAETVTTKAKPAPDGALRP